MIALEATLAIWLGLGIVFAIFGFIVEGASDLPPLHKVGLFIATVLLWPLPFLPNWQEEWPPYRRLSFPDRKPERQR